MDKEKLQVGQVYYYLQTPSLVLSNISEWRQFVPEIEEYVFVQDLSRGGHCEKNTWFALKDTKKRQLLRPCDIEKNLFESWAEAEAFQKEYIQRAIDELEEHIADIKRTQDMFIARQKVFTDFGPLFDNLPDNEREMPENSEKSDTSDQSDRKETDDDDA